MSNDIMINDGSLAAVLEQFITGLSLSKAQFNLLIKSHVEQSFKGDFYTDKDRENIITQIKMTLIQPHLSWEEFVPVAKILGFNIGVAFLPIQTANPAYEHVEEKVEDKSIPAGRKSKKGLKNILDLKLVDTNLNHRVSALLFNHKIVYIGQIAQMTVDQLRQISGVGEKSIAQVCDTLHEFGIVLNSRFPDWKIPSEEDKAVGGTGQTAYDKTLLEASFPTYLINDLNKKGLYYVGDLAKLTREELEKKGVAHVFAAVIVQKLQRMGIQLGTDLKGWKPPFKKPKTNK